MKKLYCYIFFQVLLFGFLLSNYSIGQDTLHKRQAVPVQFNAGFDVIILKNGELIYGLVKEVNLINIRYQRTDIPDGPIYVIPRNEVYAISYRNQVKDIINPVGTTWFTQSKTDSSGLTPAIISVDSFLKKKESISFRNGNVLAAIGIIRGFTDVDNADKYSTSTTFPVLTLSYEVHKNDNLRFGLQAGLGSHKFSLQEYSNYDSATKNMVLKENIFSLHVYAKYSPAGIFGNFKPYVLGGLGPRYSYVHSEYTLRFVNNTNQTVLVKSGSRSVDIGALLRIGTEYYISDQFRFMADAGIGPSIIQIGIVFHTDKFK